MASEAGGRSCGRRAGPVRVPPRALRLWLRIVLGTLCPALLALPAAQAQSLFFPDFPRGEIFSDSAVRLTLRAAPPARVADSCGLFRGPAPGAAGLAGHPFRIAAARSRTPDSAGLVFAFKAQDPDTAGAAPQLGLGFHYVIGYCSDGKATPELPLWVATRQAPSISSPKAQETSSSPTIAWAPVPGVPAYHLLLSDQAIDIDPDKGTVSGASIIWQAIVSQTSIPYGTPDPSGNFSQVPAPPLSPGVPYNLVILNNYDGRSALATSSKAQGLKLFAVQPPGPALKPPKNLAPAQDKSLAFPNDSVVDFRWTRATAASGGAAANTYQLFVYSLERQDGLDVLIPIWRTEVTDTSARLDARRVLLTRRYVWKVFALSEAGAGTVGDTTSFRYRNDVQTLSVKVQSAADGRDLGDVRVTVAPRDGSADPLPLFTANDGYAEKTLAVGGYSLAFAKDGYLAQSRSVELRPDAPLSLAISLAPADCRLTGRVTDAAGAGLSNVEAGASGGGRSISARTDAQGYWLLGLPPGAYAIGFAKADYQGGPDTAVVLAAGDALDLGTRRLERAQAALTGTVSNDKGAALAGCDVTVKAAAGAVARALRTDDKGAFSAFLSPGAYAVTAARAGFSAETKTVQLAEAASLAFTLVPGASLIKGRVSLLAWPAPGAPQSAPLPGAAVDLIDRLRGTAQKAETDARGEFTFSADTGTYLARASRPGKGLPDSTVIRVAAQRSTYGADLSLQGFATVRGTLRVSPDTVIDPASVSVTLIAPSGAVAATAVPQAAPAAGNAGAMAYSLEGVPDGTYRLACGAPGYGPDAEPTVAIQDGLWRTGQDLILKKATRTLTFAFTAGGKSVPGSVRLITPRAALLAAGTRSGPAAAGSYTLDAVPDSADLIPLARYAFPLSSAGAADTTLSLAFPFSHRPGPLAFADGKVSLTLDAQARADSLLIVYGYGAPSDTFRATAAQLFGPAGPRTFAIRPGPQGGTLAYWFRIKAGGLIYSNEDPARRFRAQVEPSRELALLELAAGDSLRLPARTKGKLHLHAYDAAGRRLDSLLDARGGIRWQADSALGIKLDKRSKRELTYQTGAATVPRGPGAAAKRAAGGRAQAAGWDSLRVTATLDGVEKSLSLPAQVAEASANKLVLTSTLGEAVGIDAPAPFGLFATAFDTTFDPDLELVPSPSLSLDPPEAGAISEMRVTLDPRFIGPLRVLARQSNADGSEAATELGALRDSLARGLNVGQILRAGDTARLLFHDKRLELRIPDSAFRDRPQAALRLFRRSVSKSFAGGAGYSVDGPLWEVSNPSGAAFTGKLRISVGLPPGDREWTFKRFDAARLDWKDPEDSAAAGDNSFGRASLSADIADLDGNYYGLWGASRPLTAGAVRIIPNPFSPQVLASRDGNAQYGARIRLEPESDRSAEVTLTAKIYTLDGELLRVLVDHKTVPKGPVEFYWDGRAEGGRWARNGRYLLEVAVNATGTSRTRYTLKPIVVFR